MSNSFIATQTVAPAGATDLDAEKLAAAGPGGEDLYRERIQITGDTLVKVATVSNSPPPKSDYGLTTRQPQPDTGTVTSVVASATNVTLLAANASRYGATVYNDGDKIIYLKLGATASTTSFTTQLQKNDYYEVPFGYRGILDGIWSAAGGGAGSARVTELT